MSSHEPAHEIRRRILTEKRDQFRALAYEAELDAVATLAQLIGVSESQRNRAAQDLRNKATNCRSAAARLDGLLQELERETPTAPDGDQPEKTE